MPIVHNTYKWISCKRKHSYQSSMASVRLHSLMPAEERFGLLEQLSYNLRISMVWKHSNIVKVLFIL